MRPFRFGTVGSPLSTPKKPGGSVGAVYQIASLGLSALELGWVQAVRVTPETCAQIAMAAKETEIVLSVHAPYFINLNASDDEWPKSRQRLMDAAYYGFLAGATDIVFHPGSYFGERTAQVMGKVVSRLQGCVEELQAKGIKVTLRPETMGKSAMIGSLEDVLLMSREVPQVQPCLDFAHLHARAGDGSMNSYNEWTRVLDAYASALGEDSLKRLHIHLSGIEYSAKGERNHLPIRESDFNVEALFTALHDRDCAGRILCESPNLETDALWMQETWDTLFTSG
ncbi:TIM barrel protein [uncultured Thermanaerothrix sp.]|uniref:TIM barrel protein n=1 Tax=uncultured Thermanaerothrix sp. TaxID=1195149 RepID=UPI00260B15B2|nr:TIM barrel protein [uncultured Thermanaerothrix sp.]